MKFRIHQVPGGYIPETRYWYFFKKYLSSTGNLLDHIECVAGKFKTLQEAKEACALYARKPIEYEI